MKLEEIKKQANPFKGFNIVISLCLLFVFISSWTSTEMSVPVLIEGWGHMVEYISGNPNIEGSGFFPPSTTTRDFTRYIKSMLETIQMAVVALVLSICIAFPLSFFASRNILRILIPGHKPFHRAARRSIYFCSMLFANVSRSINEIIWALLFVSAVGLGPMAGILALGIHTGGVLTKLLAEGNEAVDQGPVDALVATGAGFFKVIRFAVVPQIMPHFVSMMLYRFESDLRSAAILGFVGAGGIGFYLFDKIRSFENQSVSVIIIIIVSTVWLIDQLSAIIRKKVI